MLTTFTSYGNLTQHRQDELLQRMAQDPLPLTENAPRALVAMDPAVLERLERAIDRLGPRAGQTYCWLKRCFPPSAAAQVGVQRGLGVGCSGLPLRAQTIRTSL
jgi:hypothetical protein